MCLYDTPVVVVVVVVVAPVVSDNSGAFLSFCLGSEGLRENQGPGFIPLMPLAGSWWLIRGHWSAGSGRPPSAPVSRGLCCAI